MKHDMLRRFAFIEARLLWADGLTANELADTFGIARQNAQQSIKAYDKLHPGQLQHDKRQRRQAPTETFEPQYIRPGVSRFLDYQRAASYTAHFYDEPGWSDLPFTDADALVRPLYDQAAVRTALTALRRRSVVVIGYWAKSGARTRRISPHHLVHADDRYHLRAFCHETQKFLDFKLARIVTAELSHEDWISDEADSGWHERVELEFEINPQLPTDARAALQQDHVKAGETTVKVRGVRKAIAFYVERRFARIDDHYDVPLWRRVVTKAESTQSSSTTRRTISLLA
jgi:predicted DNA-binding transcriptional regulator YafY